MREKKDEPKLLGRLPQRKTELKNGRIKIWIDGKEKERSRGRKRHDIVKTLIGKDGWVGGVGQGVIVNRMWDIVRL